MQDLVLEFIAVNSKSIAAFAAGLVVNVATVVGVNLPAEVVVALNTLCVTLIVWLAPRNK